MEEEEEEEKGLQSRKIIQFYCYVIFKISFKPARTAKKREAVSETTIKFIYFHYLC